MAGCIYYKHNNRKSTFSQLFGPRAGDAAAAVYYHTQFQQMAQMQNFHAVHNTSGSQDVTQFSTESQSSAKPSTSFAEIMAHQEEAEKTWFVNKKKLISQKPLKKITWTKDSEVKAVESSVHLFVGSLKPETG